MKKIFTLLSLFFIGVSFAQIGENVDRSGSAQTNKLPEMTTHQKAGSSMMFFNPPREVDGTEYLFDDWKNYAIIHTEDNQRFSLKNINLNIKQNVFVSKIDEDSLFTFNFNNIKKVEINGKNYKNYYWDDDIRVYEIIYEG